MVYLNEMNFMKSFFILVKVDELYNVLKSASHCLLVERSKKIELGEKLTFNKDLQMLQIEQLPLEE